MTSREITPSDFHLIVVGTGLQESLLAAGAAKAGKKVLHIDTADFYGSHWASHQLGFFEKWCRMHASSAGPLYSNAEVYKGHNADLGPSNEYNIDLAPKLVYSTGRLIDALLGGAAQNYLDFKLLQKRADVFKDSTLGLLDKNALKSFLDKLEQHAKATQDEHKGSLWLDDRAFSEVLQEQRLNTQLQETILYALAFADAAQVSPSQNAPQPGQDVHQQTGHQIADSTVSSAATSEKQPDTKHPCSSGGSRAPGKTATQQQLYTAAGMHSPEASSDTRQSSGEQAYERAGSSVSQRRANKQNNRSRDLMSHAQGMEALAQYRRSVKRYDEEIKGAGAFLLPVYGGGELPQAFCRVAAVADALYVLRQGIGKFVMDADTGLCQALLTSSGQELKASAFAGNPETLSQFCRAEAPAVAQTGLSRAVLILDAPLVEDKSQVDKTTVKNIPDEIAQMHILVMLPPGVAGNAHPVRALQLGTATACAPKDRYIVHLSTLQTAATAREDLQQAAQSLADLSSLQVSSSAAGAAEVSRGDDGHSHSAAEPQAASSSVTPAHAAQKNGAHDASEPPKKPRALFLAYYNQALTEDLHSSWELPQNVALCGMPSPSVAYEDAVLEAEGLLEQLFPGLDALFSCNAPAMDDESDEEAIEGMSEALDKAGEGDTDQP